MAFLDSVIPLKVAALSTFLGFVFFFFFHINRTLQPTCATFRELFKHRHICKSSFSYLPYRVLGFGNQASSNWVILGTTLGFSVPSVKEEADLELGF